MPEISRPMPELRPCKWTQAHTRSKRWHQYAIQIRILFTSKPFCNHMYGGWPGPSGPRPIFLVQLLDVIVNWISEWDKILYALLPNI